MFDQILQPRRFGRYQIRPWWEPRAMGALFRWGELHPGRIFSLQLGPLGVHVEPIDEDAA